MSRAIKFRTWDKQNQEFSEWTNRDPFFSTSHGKIFFWERTRNEDGSYGGDVVLEDTGDRFVLQQFTGLLDKNGKEIYEGDIVKCKRWRNEYSATIYETVEAVEFLNGEFNPRVHKDLCDDGYYSSGISEIEVIGNIFENK